MKAHYKAFDRGKSQWWFTSPLGTHGDYPTSQVARKAAKMMKGRHQERADGEGAEAAILRAHFERRQEVAR